jgi:hypothetical protein
MLSDSRIFAVTYHAPRTQLSGLGTEAMEELGPGIECYNNIE